MEMEKEKVWLQSKLKKGGTQKDVKCHHSKKFGNHWSIEMQFMKMLSNIVKKKISNKKTKYLDQIMSCLMSKNDKMCL